MRRGERTRYRQTRADTDGHGGTDDLDVVRVGGEFRSQRAAGDGLLEKELGHDEARLDQPVGMLDAEDGVRLAAREETTPTPRERARPTGLFNDSMVFAGPVPSPGVCLNGLLRC